jgi:hypothetical protein
MKLNVLIYAAVIYLQAQQIHSMFPHVPIQAITLDLADTHSVSLTVDRILNDSIYIPREGGVAGEEDEATPLPERGEDSTTSSRRGSISVNTFTPLAHGNPVWVKDHDMDHTGNPQSRDMEHNSHDIEEESHDMAQESHDLGEESRDMDEESHDVEEKPCDVEPASSDLEHQSHNLEQESVHSDVQSHDLSSPHQFDPLSQYASKSPHQDEVQGSLHPHELLHAPHRTNIYPNAHEPLEPSSSALRLRRPAGEADRVVGVIDDSKGSASSSRDQFPSTSESYSRLFVSMQERKAELLRRAKRYEDVI